MQYLLVLGLSILIIQQSVAPPVTKEKKDDNSEHEEYANTSIMDLEYNRYLQEVVEVLENDPVFKDKLRKADESSIRSGKIAHELEFVNHNVRSKLDEIKRQEIERLRHLAMQEMEIKNGLDRKHLKVPEHLDHENLHTFEIDDLKKLIAKVTKDLDEADKKRREQFKEYEMEKKFEQEQKLKGNTGMDEEARKKYQEEIHNLEEKHKKHEPLHHPGSKQQLEEVWEKQDHMEDQEFDPKAFFHMHDVDGNGVWDQNELKALFREELNKIYSDGHPEDDPVERAEEMERMREHVIREFDFNKDGLISIHEFLDQTKRADFQQDEGWKPLDEQKIYSQEEYEAFERQRQEEIQRLIAKGMIPPYQYGNAPPLEMLNQQGPYNGHPVQQPQYQQHPPQYQGQIPQHQMQGQVPPQYQQVPQQYHGQAPQQVPGQVPQQNQMPQQHYQPAVPQQQYQGQIPQQQYQGQVPQQQHIQGQVPQQQQQHQQHIQGQVPQQQQHQQHIQGQVPQQQQQQQQQVPVEVNQQPQVHQAQQNPPAAQVSGNVPAPNSIPDVKKV